MILLSRTYPIAVGDDGVCHDEVEERFAAELDQLSSDNGRLFYHGGLKKNVKVYVLPRFLNALHISSSNFLRV